jgi:hypothetical protein
MTGNLAPSLEHNKNEKALNDFLPPPAWPQVIRALLPTIGRWNDATACNLRQIIGS